MTYHLKNAHLYQNGMFAEGNYFLSDGVFFPHLTALFLLQLKMHIFFPVSLMYMFICESRVFLTKRRLPQAALRVRGAGM